MSEVKPYSEELGKKEQVRSMFDNIAGSYDFLNGFLSLGIDNYWRKNAINQLKDRTINKLLDVATGTGDFALQAYSILHPQQIVGVDISPKMLEIGNEKIKKKELENTIRLEIGDSESLHFEDNTFDAVTVAFGVRNYENLEKGLSEMRRVLKPEGRLVVLEFSKPKVFPFKQLFNVYFKYILPLIGRLKSRDNKAYSYLYESVQHFPEGNSFLELLSKIGFNKFQCKPLSLGICSIYIADK